MLTSVWLMKTNSALKQTGNGTRTHARHVRGSHHNHSHRNGAPRRKVWTDRALMDLGHDSYRYELLDGKLIVMSPAGFDHGDICSNIIIELGSFVRPRRLGSVCDGQTGFRLPGGAVRKTVLAPDVAFVRRERVAAIKDRRKFFEGAPDLAVEVLSPGERLKKTEAKVQRYFLSGCRLAWIVDPIGRQVYVYQPGGSVVTKSAEGWLDGAEVIPGFRLRVKEMFD